MAELAKAGDFCPNPACSDYEKLGGKIIRHGRTRSGHQRHKCLTCGKTFTETRGTIFYRRRTEKAECLALIAEGSRISSVKGHKEDTISAWLQIAAEHADEFENIFLSEFRISRGQLDGLWSCCEECRAEKKGHAETEESGQFFRSTMMDMDSRLRAARGSGKSETEASASVFRKLSERGHSDGPPPTVSDGWGGIREAEIFGKVPEYSEKGRPPSKKRPQPGWKAFADHQAAG